MSCPPKKREIASEERNSSDDSDDGSSSGNEDTNQEYTGNEEIQVEFEGRSPIDSDFHGIKTLLGQLFLKAHLNLSELTELIIGQSFVTSVVKQSEIDMEDDDEEDEDPNDVYGITTVINLTEKQNYECVSQLRKLLSELSSEHGTPEVTSQVKHLLADTSKQLGLIINERFINIPAQISVPLLESLCKEIKKACDKKMAYDFSYYIFICKLYKVDAKPAKGKKKHRKGKTVADEAQIVWSNPEEELFEELADMSFEFSVKNETDSGLGGNWLEDDISMTPYRKVLFIPAPKLESLISRIQEFVKQ